MKRDNARSSARWVLILAPLVELSTDAATWTGVRTTMPLLDDRLRTYDVANYFDVPGNARCAVRLGIHSVTYPDSRDGVRVCLGAPRNAP